MLLDDYLPEFQFSKTHRKTINAPVDVVYKKLKSVDLGSSAIIKILFKIRGLPDSMMTFEGMQNVGFTLLGEDSDLEILFGLVGRFWTIKGGIFSLEPDQFKPFQKAGYAKTAWNFSLRESGKNQTELSTETRIQCLDQKSLRRFRIYWFLIGPFSGIIRKKMLDVVKKEAETHQGK